MTTKPYQFNMTYPGGTRVHTNECRPGEYTNQDLMEIFHQHQGPGRVFQLSPGSNSGPYIGRLFDDFIANHLGGTRGVYHRGCDAWGLKFDLRSQFKKVGNGEPDRLGNKPTIYKHRTLPVLLVTNKTWTPYAGRYILMGEAL